MGTCSTRVQVPFFLILATCTPPHPIVLHLYTVHTCRVKYPYVLVLHVRYLCAHTYTY